MAIRTREYQVFFDTRKGRVTVEIKYRHTNGAVTWIDESVSETLGLDGVE